MAAQMVRYSLIEKIHELNLANVLAKIFYGPIWCRLGLQFQQLLMPKAHQTDPWERAPRPDLFSRAVQNELSSRSSEGWRWQLGLQLGLRHAPYMELELRGTSQTGPKGFRKEANNKVISWK